MLDIITHTPHWVFALLIVLCLFGALQTRTRRVRPAITLLLPVGMLILSMAGVLQYTSHWRAGLAYWMLGLAISATTLSRLMSPHFVSLDTHDNRLTVQGSWLPLLVILGIFVTRYALGVAHAMHVPALGVWAVQMAVSGTLGVWSGYFAWRGWVCGQAMRSTRRSSGLV
ncbi:DUF6622 family protein [Pseudomonas sp. MWU15-20650]|uniref:DUF6622 family protein n=1 Tax=Pseudomonas sp. MWU15-20650 TaxID=2933107 RepID=UPI00201053BD|nr:DUF6622 family protein [Pseudomonas sp. MWU15-20650]